jgi:hypothetical protein
MGKESRQVSKHLQRNMKIPKEKVKHIALIKLARRKCLKGIASTPMFSSIMRRMDQ